MLRYENQLQAVICVLALDLWVTVQQKRKAMQFGQVVIVKQEAKKEVLVFHRLITANRFNDPFTKTDRLHNTIDLEDPSSLTVTSPRAFCVSLGIDGLEAHSQRTTPFATTGNNAPGESKYLSAIVRTFLGFNPVRTEPPRSSRHRVSTSAICSIQARKAPSGYPGTD